jgi:hypothetical protein
LYFKEVEVEFSSGVGFANNWYVFIERRKEQPHFLVNQLEVFAVPDRAFHTHVPAKIFLEMVMERAVLRLN